MKNIELKMKIFEVGDLKGGQGCIGLADGNRQFHVPATRDDVVLAAQHLFQPVKLIIDFDVDTPKLAVEFDDSGKPKLERKTDPIVDALRDDDTRAELARWLNNHVDHGDGAYWRVENFCELLNGRPPRYDHRGLSVESGWDPDFEVGDQVVDENGDTGEIVEIAGDDRIYVEFADGITGKYSAGELKHVEGSTLNTSEAALAPDHEYTPIRRK